MRAARGFDQTGVQRGGRPPRGFAVAPFLAALLFAATSACDGEGRRAEAPSDSTYVTVMARLSLIDQELGEQDSDRADSAREATLEAHGVTAEELRAYAVGHGGDPEHMAAVWRAIEAKVRALRPAQEEEPGPDPLQRRPVDEGASDS